LPPNLKYLIVAHRAHLTDVSNVRQFAARVNRLGAELQEDKMVCERKEPLTRPAAAGESAVAGHPLPKERADPLYDAVHF
jgi:hypothetical protein